MNHLASASFPILILVLVLGSIAGCQTSRPAPPAAATKPQLGSFGVDLDGMDRNVTPGDDFYRYVNGNWIARTEIPPDRSRYTSFTALDELAKTRERAIVEEVAAKASSGDDKKIADYYRAFMDEAAIERNGLQPIRAELDAIATLRDKQVLARAFGQTLRADVD